MKHFVIWGWLGLFAASPAALHAQQTSVFATGLNNPSKLIAVPSGGLLVTEVGAPPNSGRISYVGPGGRVQPLLDGLPSGAAAPDGTLDGPNGLALSGHTLYIANAEGDAHVSGPTPGTTVPNPAGCSSPIFSSILKVVFSADPAAITMPFVLTRAQHDILADGWPVTLENGAGDRADLELLADFRDSVPDARTIYRNSHPYGLTLHPAYPESLFVADAGMNTMVRVDLNSGRARTVARFAAIPTGIAARPAAEAVPNSVRAFGNQLLVTQLAGVPFAAGTSRVQILDPNTSEAAAFIVGLNSAIDITWEDRPDAPPIFYVLEFSAGLAQSPPRPGRLKRYASPDGVVFVDNLRTPTSMALDAASHSLYVTDRAGGNIVKVSLP